MSLAEPPGAVLDKCFKRRSFLRLYLGWGYRRGELYRCQAREPADLTGKVSLVKKAEVRRQVNPACNQQRALPGCQGREPHHPGDDFRRQSDLVAKAGHEAGPAPAKLRRQRTDRRRAPRSR